MFGHRKRVWGRGLPMLLLSLFTLCGLRTSQWPPAALSGASGQEMQPILSSLGPRFQSIHKFLKFKVEMWAVSIIQCATLHHSLSIGYVSWVRILSADNRYISWTFVSVFYVIQGLSLSTSTAEGTGTCFSILTIVTLRYFEWSVRVMIIEGRLDIKCGRCPHC